MDSNQADIVEAFRKCGASVHSLAPVGDGVPDLLLGICGYTMLVEVKDGDKVPSAQRLTSDQQRWIRAWKGSPVHVIRSPAEAVELFKFLAGRNLGRF